MTDKRDETGEIVLAGETVKIAALTLDQLQEVLPALERLTNAPDVGARIKECRAVICTVTGKPDAELGKLKVSLEELLAGVQTICKVAGLEEVGKKLAARKG
jgi:hypothetical protein